MTMTWVRALAAAGIAGVMALGADLNRPLVLKGSEPVDTGIVTLPGAPAPPPRVLKPLGEIPPPAPAPLALPEAPPAVATETPLPPLRRPLKPLPALPAAEPPASPALPDAPVLPEASLKAVKLPPIDDRLPALRKTAKLWIPPDFERDSAAYCQQRIGEWTQPDSYNLLGTALRQRPAAGENGEVAGQIYAFADPTGRYREIELDFAGDTGLLRTVFVYPKTLTWVEARRMWGNEVSATDANKGRTFYSFSNRHLDVLVGADGKVISLGLY